MQVGVDQLVHLDAGGALAAGVCSSTFVAAQQIAGKSNGCLQLAYPLGTTEQQRVGHSPGLSVLYEPLNHILLSYDIPEIHLFQNAATCAGLELLEEIVSFIVNEDEGREVLNFDLPDGLHAKLGILNALN